MLRVVSVAGTAARLIIARSSLPFLLFHFLQHAHHTPPPPQHRQRSHFDLDHSLFALLQRSLKLIQSSCLPTIPSKHHHHTPKSNMTRGDTLVALPFMALILAAFARHNSLPFQRRGGLLQSPGQYQYQQQQLPPPPSSPAEAGGPMPSPPPPDAMVREGDTYHLPLAALRHGLSDALAWNEVCACGVALCAWEGGRGRPTR